MEIKKKARWTDHLNAAEASGMGIAAYAAQHGIKPHVLYKLRYKFRRSAARRRSEQSAFVPVRLKAQPLVKVTPAEHHGNAPGARFAMQARLDNGVVLSWTYDAASASAQANLLHTLAGLPCFG